MAPIIIFAFNRPRAFRGLIDSLLLNPEASESELFVFIDGARSEIKDEQEKVQSVIRITKSISGFKAVHISISNTNIGLATSIIEGVSKVLKERDRAIILEDDLIVQPQFLSFMNQALEIYEANTKVWSVCGYSNKVKGPESYQYNSYFAPRSSSWGWATWRDRWESVDWSFNNWNEWENYRSDFNKWGGSDCFSMLKRCRDGLINSWAIRFCFNQFLQNRLSIFPIRSLIANNGFDGEGTNCRRYSRFKYELMSDTTPFIFPHEAKTNKKLVKQALSYHSIPKRIWSRIMYLLLG